MFFSVLRQRKVVLLYAYTKNMRYKDKYPNIKKANLTIEDIASIFNYKTTMALRTSTKYHTIMGGVDKILAIANEQHASALSDIVKNLTS